MSDLRFTEYSRRLFPGRPGSGQLADAIEQLMLLVALLEREPVSDADRAGERLRVHTVVDRVVPPQGPEPLARWRFRLIGNDSGREYGGLMIAVAGGEELPLEFLGLALQIAANGARNASTSELRALVELHDRFMSDFSPPRR